MKKMMIALLAGAMMMVATSAMALTINGSLWKPVNFTGAVNGVDWLANHKPNTPATATFQVSGINFSSTNPVSYDVWLNSPNWLSDPYNVKGSFYTAGGYLGTFFEFTGTAYFNSTISITHDDGIWLSLTQNNSNPIIFDKSLNVSSTTDNFNITAGVYDFDLLYSADNSFPEILQVSGMSNPVPEPTTMLLLCLGLVGLAGVRRKFKS